eukprot:SAG11_NODE_3391_length_2478_cov_2.624632_2_plen_88_part_00
MSLTTGSGPVSRGPSRGRNNHRLHIVYHRITGRIQLFEYNPAFLIRRASRGRADIAGHRAAIWVTVMGASLLGCAFLKKWPWIFDLC